MFWTSMTSSKLMRQVMRHVTLDVIFGTTILVPYFYASLCNSFQNLAAGTHLNIKTIFPRYGGSHVKDKTVTNCFIFHMGIPILVRRHFYIQMAPWSSNELQKIYYITECTYILVLPTAAQFLSIKLHKIIFQLHSEWHSLPIFQDRDMQLSI